MKSTTNQISIVVDTNICRMGDSYCDFKKFKLSAKVVNLEMWIKYVRNEDIQIVIPEMVIRELKKQRCDLYSKKKNELLSYIDNNPFPDITINFDTEQEFDYNEYFTQQIDAFFNTSKVVVNTMPINFDFNSILERAINKRAPFEGGEKQSDKGFKDAVIWESLLEYKRNNPNRKIIYYSNDNRFDKELKYEYRKKFGEDLEIIKSDEDALKYVLQTTEKEYPELQTNLEEYKCLNQYIKENMSVIRELYIDHMKSGAWGKLDSLDVSDIEYTDLYYGRFVRAEILGKYVAVFCAQIKLGIDGLEIQEGTMEFMVEIDVDDKQKFQMMITGSGSVSSIL